MNTNDISAFFSLIFGIIAIFISIKSCCVSQDAVQLHYQQDCENKKNFFIASIDQHIEALKENIERRIESKTNCTEKILSTKENIIKQYRLATPYLIKVQNEIIERTVTEYNETKTRKDNLKSYLDYVKKTDFLFNATKHNIKTLRSTFQSVNDLSKKIITIIEKVDCKMTTRTHKKQNTKTQP